MAKKCWKLDWVDCGGTPGTAFVCAIDMDYITSGGSCGLGYFSSADAGFGTGNASEQSGSFVQVALANCSGACVGGEEPGGGVDQNDGSSAKKPVILTGKTGIGSSFTNGLSKFADGKTGTSSDKGRYQSYSPDESQVKGSDLSLEGDAYPGQLILLREDLVFSMSLARESLIEAAYLNRGTPYFFAGFWQQIAVRGYSGNPILQEGQLHPDIRESTGGSCLLRKDHYVTPSPTKGDTKGATLSELTTCNFKLQPSFPSSTAEGVVFFPDYKNNGTTPTFKGKNQIHIIDLADLYFDYYFEKVTLWVHPAWEVLSVQHTLQVFPAKTVPTETVQIDTSLTCFNGTAT